MSENPIPKPPLGWAERKNRVATQRGWNEPYPGIGNIQGKKPSINPPLNATYQDTTDIPILTEQQVKDIETAVKSKVAGVAKVVQETVDELLDPETEAGKDYKK